MRIKRFQAEGIHGYLRFNCTFHDDLTFLTGINGSGKTTVVRCIAALLCPSLLTLTQTTHDSMMLEVQVGQGTLLISSRRANDRLLLSVSTCQDPFEIPLQLFSDYAEDTTSERYDELLRHYRQLETSVSHPVLDRIRQLPTPMLLGLERRSDLFAGPGRPSRRRPDPSTFYFRNTLSASLSEAAYFVDRHYRQVQGQQDEITNQLRKRLIFQAVKYESFNRPRAFEELSSRYALAQRLAAQKETITSILQQLGLTADEVQTGLNPFFDSLSGLLKTPDIEKDLKALLEQKRSHHLPQSVLEWITNWPQLDRISAISEAVQSYINDNNRLGEPIDRYLSIVNSFLADSGKALQVSRTEGLQVQIGDRKPIPITSLSSGESQIVVLITHLVFNPAAEPANVFIIDEPELSLHLRWQELFVESLRKANPKIQMILATHSPSIILDDAEHCLDLSGALYDQVRN